MRCLVNYARRSEGLTQLRNHSSITRAARSKARDIIRCNQFSHYACGRDVGYWLHEVGYTKCSCSWKIGENIAWAGATKWNVNQKPRQIMKAWLHSPGHKENILGPAWRDQGIAVIKTRFAGMPKAVMWVNQFGVRDM